jgi:ADP-ribosylglycohydrolase
MKRRNKVRDAFFGLAIGDALGVPFEMVKREELEKDPVTDMVGNRAHSKPPGTWSDDGSMTFCTAESLLDGFDIERMGKSYLAWFDEGHWSADGKAFGSGGTTRAALKKIREGHSAAGAGSVALESNGNGSLMRVLPLAFYLDRVKPSNSQMIWIISQVSSITHGHEIAKCACYYYVKFAMHILQGYNKQQAYDIVKSQFPSISFDLECVFQRLITKNIADLPSSEIRSGSYVVDSLEAAIWCLMTSNSYKETVLKAVNLGGDSDSTAAIAGGLAGILYGLDDVPEAWMQKLARKDDIEKLCDEFTYAFLNWYA